MTTTSCFDRRTCCCGPEGVDFDRIVREETKLNISMRALAHSNMGWFCGFDDLKFCAWPLSKDFGVYILWEKDDYCAKHEMFHCRALYVGKGLVKARIFDHAQKKGFTEENRVYFTFVEMKNRHAKYVEQLLLDLYELPLNKSENHGSGRLCAYIDQSEADFGTFQTT